MAIALNAVSQDANSEAPVSVTGAPSTLSACALEDYFQSFREKTVGFDASFESPCGNKPLVYADWTASGRLYGPIEDILKNDFGPLVGNTHTETNFTGTSMTLAYHQAQQIIKRHVNASKDDILLAVGSGMTGAMAKLQRILGYKIPSPALKYVDQTALDRPVVFMTHMEHHSNQTAWFETIATVEIILPDADGFVSLKHFAVLLEKYKAHKIKIASVTSCSNVTGISTPYHQIAKMIHQVGGWCFVDFACSAPYVAIDMHPADPLEKLDAIFFSPHKFLGGPGTTGILIFNMALYSPGQIPDQPGGGTVTWTNPWGEHQYYDDIQTREDGGTPPFIQTIQSALCVKLKEKMGVNSILTREHQMVDAVFAKLMPIENIHILADNIKDRLGVVSFYIDDLHFNLGVKLLNDRFGIQVRGGCSCAGTYGHYLLNVEKEFSNQITCKIDRGDLTEKPGWIRMSIHPTMSNKELSYILDAIIELSQHHKNWGSDYSYCPDGNIFNHRAEKASDVLKLFELPD
jgi:selenocysteine lyase/cysteine desulfurase